jgi:hypothetical protein
MPTNTSETELLPNRDPKPEGAAMLTKTDFFAITALGILLTVIAVLCLAPGLAFSLFF